MQSMNRLRIVLAIDAVIFYAVWYFW